MSTPFRTRNMVNRKRAVRALLSVGVSLSAVITAAAAGQWHIAQGDVSVKCPMTIGGSFDAKTNALTGALTSTESSTLDGSVAVDLRMLDTGISLRNDH